MIYVMAVSYQDVRNWCHENDTDVWETTAITYPAQFAGIRLTAEDRMVHAPYFHRNPLYFDMVNMEQAIRAKAAAKADTP